MTLLDECLEALQDNYKILSNTQKEQLLKELFETFSLTNWGRINWVKLKTVKKCMDTENFIDSIIDFIGGNNEDIIIVWDEINHPKILLN
ncbi:hypothetical protein HZI73_18805 [Vallitalea pronyensis]|uniref:Uncharacterized protein n=1 Tax=Vallitalea pronyensis TaxID=1348613 RepID=A0A8J8MMI4_9FIRM|nr:hypothetical protein [Vallitalea pronyensis]QUI24216.1 hypothetical protein HZI73_18805 [Vallitalea pronyensis]